MRAGKVYLMNTGKFLTVAGVLVVAAVALSACKEQEQGRPLLYKKGVYLGSKAKPLTSEQVSRIQARTALQGAGNTALPGNVVTSQPNVRPPGAGAVAKPSGGGK